MQTIKCLGLLLFTASLSANAAVSEQEANRLGRDLTLMGAEMAGNASGTIPAWTGTVLGAPANVDYKGTGSYYPNPYPNEKPLFIITAENHQQYAANLTDGLLAMFKKYPNFAMHIYPTKRDTRYADRIYQNVRHNATHSALSDDGNSDVDIFGGPGFPLAKTAYEVLWNHISAPLLNQSESTWDSVAVWSNGDRTSKRVIEQREIAFYSQKMSREQFNQQAIGGKVLLRVIEPPRDSGQLLLVHESRDLSATGRSAWVYMPGTRRVRRAPSIAFDFPAGIGGLSTVDDALLFNGSNIRFDWTYDGKREVFIPYNNYALDDPGWSFDELLLPGHVNPHAMRWELHRVHVVTGSLKQDKRHIYGKRRLFMVEDSWHAVLADNYDNKGALWRTNSRTMVNMYDLPGVASRVEMYHDLQKGAYLANYLVNRTGGPARHVESGWPDSYFTPDTLRKMGK